MDHCCSSDSLHESELKKKVIIAFFCTFPLLFFHNPYLDFVLASIVLFYPGLSILKMGFKSYLSFNLNMYSLIALGVMTAYLYSFSLLLQGDLGPFYFESSAMIMTLVLLGQFLDVNARKRTDEELRSLILLKPTVAHLVTSFGESKEIEVKDVKIGDRLLVKPGEKIPVDGIVIEGRSWVNESMFTGEAIPVYRKPFDKVIGGSLNGDGSITIEASIISGETILSQMIHLMEEAKAHKAPVQVKVDKIAKIFTPLVILVAILTYTVWVFLGAPHSEAISFAIAVLIIACPCALGLATPLSIVVGMGMAAKRGILMKNGEVMEEMASVDTLIIDKTGTLTEGIPLLTKIASQFPFSEMEVLKIGASVEALSEHPFGKAVYEGAKLKKLTLEKVDHFQRIAGKGVVARLDGIRLAVGNERLMDDLKVEISELQKKAALWEKEGQTVTFVSQGDALMGLLAVSDPLKFTSEEAVRGLKNEKIKVVIATGDSQEVARAIGRQVGIEAIEAELLPQEKMALVQKFQGIGRIVAMAGDGVNDAPAMALANVGIAMGRGSAVTIENASMTLLKGDLRGILVAREISRLTVNNIHQNLFLAFVYNIISIPIAAGVLYPFFGVVLTPVMASIAMTLSSLSVVFNALRMRLKKY